MVCATIGREVLEPERPFQESPLVPRTAQEAAFATSHDTETVLPLRTRIGVTFQLMSEGPGTPQELVALRQTSGDTQAWMSAPVQESTTLLPEQIGPQVIGTQLGGVPV